MTVVAPLHFRVEDGTAYIILSRPERGNSINLAMAEALREAAMDCDLDPSIRCVVLSGEGKLFCGGGDVASLAAAGAGAPKLVKSITTHLHSAVATLARMAKPLVTVINGPAAGAGVSLAVLGDIALAARTAHFSLAYTALSLTPDGGSTWLLPRLIGLRRTQELLLTNRRIGADEAVAMGLITNAVAGDVLWHEAGSIIEQLKSGATAAIGTVRRLLLSSYSSTLETQMEEEALAMTAALAGAEGAAGVAAFAGRQRTRSSRQRR